MKVETTIGSKYIKKTFTVKVPELVDAIRKGYRKEFHAWLNSRGISSGVTNYFEVPFRVYVDEQKEEIKFVLVKRKTKLDYFLQKGGVKL